MVKTVDGPRTVQPHEYQAIWPAVSAHVERLRGLGRAWAKHISAEHVCEQIMSGKVNSFVYGNYLVVLDIGGTWTSPGVKMFEELLTLRIYDDRGSSYRQVVRCMESLARANDCVGVLLGAVGAYDDQLVRVIERLGYESSGGFYYKEV